ncbi:MAG: IS110 family transposase [Planctomycetes bacterium]|nr:IS110 family transposase [Planctomycetota bacterium]
MTYYCGIDLGRSSSHVCVIDEEQRVLFDRKLPNRPEAITACLTPFRDQVRTVVESTATWYWLVDCLQDAQIPVTLAHTYGLHAITRAKIKTDKRDARTLARLLRSNMIPPAYIYPRDRRPLRDALRRRWKLVQMRADEYRGMRTILAQHGLIEITLADIKTMEEADIPSVLAHPALRLHARQELERIALYSTQIQALEEEISKSIEDTDPYRNLTSIPGVGIVIALTLICEIGDISRFPDARKFSSYCRVVPGCADSGDSRRRGRGSKQGNPYLKWALNQAAIRAVQHDPRFRAFFEKHAKRHVGRTQKIITYGIVAHRLALAVYHILKHHVPYQEDRLFTNPPTADDSSSYGLG